MKIKRLYVVFISIIVVTFHMLYAVAPGETEGITLVFPSGVRQNAMGETGTALADDENLLFFNPAGLARNNNRLKRGAFSYTYENLLPRKEVDNVWHMNIATAYKPEKVSIGGFGLNINMVHMPHNDSISGPNLEGVFSLSHSFNFKRWSLERHYFGYSIKYLQSKFDSFTDTTYHKNYYYNPDSIDYDTSIYTIPKRTGYSLAFDIGYIFDISKHFHMGLNIANIGPAIDLTNGYDYIPCPLPFTLNLAIAYTDLFVFKNKSELALNSEFRMDREIAKTHWGEEPDPFYKALSTDLKDKTFKENVEEINFHMGLELSLDNKVAVRCGYLYDEIGERREFHWGLGTNLFDHFTIDFYMIVSPETDNNAGIRKNQWGMSLSSYRILDWKKNKE